MSKLDLPANPTLIPFSLLKDSLNIKLYSL